MIIMSLIRIALLPCFLFCFHFYTNAQNIDSLFHTCIINKYENSKPFNIVDSVLKIEKFFSIKNFISDISISEYKKLTKNILKGKTIIDEDELVKHLGINNLIFIEGSFFYNYDICLTAINELYNKEIHKDSPYFKLKSLLNKATEKKLADKAYFKNAFKSLTDEEFKNPLFRCYIVAQYIKLFLWLETEN
jgi:uncharacterized protein YqgQ